MSSFDRHVAVAAVAVRNRRSASARGVVLSTTYTRASHVVLACILHLDG